MKKLLLLLCLTSCASLEPRPPTGLEELQAQQFVSSVCDLGVDPFLDLLTRYPQGHAAVAVLNSFLALQEVGD